MTSDLHSVFGVELGPLARLCVGYILIVIHIIGDVGSSACAQAIKGAIPTFQLTATRLLLQTFCTYVTIKCAPKSSEYTDIKWVIFAIVGYLVFNFGFYDSSTCMPLADQGALFNLFFFVTMCVLVGVFHDKSVGHVNLIAMLVCVIGSVMITQPSYFFHHNHPSPLADAHRSVGNGSELSTNGSRDIGNLAELELHRPPETPIYCYVLLLIGSSGCACSAFTLAHRLSHVRLTDQLFCMSAGAFILSVPSMFYMDDIKTSFIYDVRMILMVLGHSVFSVVSLYPGFAGVRLIGGIRWSIGLTFTLVVDVGVQYIFMTNYQPGKHNALELTGVFVAMAGLSMPLLLEVAKKRYGGLEHYEMKDLGTK